MRRVSFLTALFALLCGCRTLATVSPRVVRQLKETPGGYVAGPPTGLGVQSVLNNEDFVYTIASSVDAQQLAAARMGMKFFFLSVYDTGTVTPRVDVPINVTEFDVESVAFSPDGTVVAATSRDGALRLFNAKTGALVGNWLTDEPLVSVAFHPTKPYLATGGAKGTVSLLAWPRLTLLSELRAHTHEVRALAFTPEGALVSGGWDKTLRILTPVDGTGRVNTARLFAERQAGTLRIRAIAADMASATFAIDARVAEVAITTALAQALGLQIETLTQTKQVTSPSGTVIAPVVPQLRLRFKMLHAAPFDAVVCDACVPSGAQGVLGQAFLARFALAQDERTQEAVLTALNDSALGPAASGVTLTPTATHPLPAYLNDFALDAKGTRAALALSESPAQRNRDVYEREKRKETEAERPWDCAALFDLKDGKILRTVHGHRGVVSTVGLSPDGETLASGGWDKQVLLHREGARDALHFGWSVRRVRFSPDGRFLLIAAWTPQNPLGDKKSDPSALVVELGYADTAVIVAP
ncbi:MAG: hypothetical protein K1X64_17455 [Myxococcaceae bacterium]|nr:hypothetical protein [Myxococcaceae bacterium]